MNNQLHNSISIYLTNAESIQNINQSSNENDNNHQKLENQREIFFNHSSLYIRICIISLSILFIVIGFVYRNACTLKHNVPIFLIIFGILIFLNCLIYNILGATFIVLLRHARSCSLDKHFRILFASLLGIIFGLMIFIWWFLGTIWWIRLTLRLNAALHHPTSLAFCHPIVYWTALIANIFGLIGFIVQICIAIGGSMTASKQTLKNRS